ncbi:NAD(P)/FAD-dependent oxidoreductase [Rhodococcus sp. HNM0569]|uniref:NAD(P)/FAD-dependent oxidoreductase n=1 Tax=Rhodococcus sp. HNM0569 TaxID=2716340 RepID=UPI00146E1CB1|nr:NAD(P)/FAD-dependent oxidoreductase [Rhodococcus sp. HNM0569]NLU82280.1 NAD(P)/FAD-dependent oxidoreductase [Rhodococcus sp. HNM0569]
MDRTTRTETADSTDVVIVGSGFGALATAKKLGKAGTPFVLISETTEHLFQPLLYQVATGVLSAAEIAPPVRSILAKFPNGDVRLGRVVDVRPDDHEVDYVADGVVHTIGYKSLVAATGARQSYFGNDHFAKVTFALKTVEDAEALRKQILRCFEEANTTKDAARRRDLLSFVVVGAGPTGVELAGQIRELAQRYVEQTFHGLSADDVSVKLVEGAGLVLPPFGGKLSEYSKDSLEKSGVEVVLDTMVTDIDEHGVTVKSKTDGEQRITAETVIWSAGVQANDFAGVLAQRTGCDTDRAGRLLINRDLTVGGYADVYAIGDMTSLDKLPGQSPVAMQEGRHVAKTITGKIARGTAFKYMDKGSMAIINRFRAITRVGKLELTGMLAWLTWLAVHVYYLIGFRNRAVTVLSWFESFLGHQRPHFHMAQDPEPARFFERVDSGTEDAAAASQPPERHEEAHAA